jgi:hypothetical protein
VLKTAIVLVFVGAGSITICHAETRPLTEAEKKIIINSYGNDLKDPASAQYRWPNLTVKPSMNRDEPIYCFEVNAKNSYGGYAGFKIIGGQVRRRNGRIFAYSYIMGDSSNAIMKDAADSMCELAGYTFRR